MSINEGKDMSPERDDVLKIRAIMDIRIKYGGQIPRMEKTKGKHQ